MKPVKKELWEPLYAICSTASWPQVKHFFRNEKDFVDNAVRNKILYSFFKDDIPTIYLNNTIIRIIKEYNYAKSHPQSRMQEFLGNTLERMNVFHIVDIMYFVGLGVGALFFYLSGKVYDRFLDFKYILFSMIRNKL